MKIGLTLRHHLSFALRSPINPDLLKTVEGRAEVKKRLQQRYKPESLLSTTIEHFEGFRKELHSFEKLSQQCNQLKQQIKESIKNKNQSDEVDKLKNKLSTAKLQLQKQQDQLKKVKLQYESNLQQIGNQVHPETPISQDEAHNKTLKYYHPHKNLVNFDKIEDHQGFIKQNFKSEKKEVNYQKLTEIFGIADLPRGQKVSGHRGYFLCTNGVKLALALAQYGLDFLQSKGYSLYQPPALILESVLLDSCQLSSIQTDMYRYKQDQLCLIATSEQSLAGYNKSQTFEPKQLPKKMAGYSTCFRREAGAHGKDIHGLFRLHQFEKVEQFVVCNEEDSWKMMQEMVQNAEQFYQSLEIPYRLVDIVSGQLNDPAARKIDLEAWYPGQQRFRELVSISNCTDYQARMLETKYRSSQGVKYPHMLNGTLTAIQRTMTCLLEHFYYSKDQVLRIPTALQPYIRTNVLKKMQI